MNKYDILNIYRYFLHGFDYNFKNDIAVFETYKDNVNNKSLNYFHNLIIKRHRDSNTIGIDTYTRACIIMHVLKEFAIK